MPQPLAYALAALSVVAGIFATLMMLVFGMASLANSTPEQLRTGKIWLWSIFSAGLACAVGGVWLMVAARPMTGLAVGGLPAATVFVLMVYFTVK